MTAVIDIPDDLYQQVTKRSAALGRLVPDVTVELYERWLAEQKGGASQPSTPTAGGTQWLEDWFHMADEAIAQTPQGTTARELLNEDRNRLEGQA